MMIIKNNRPTNRVRYRYILALYRSQNGNSR